MYYTGKSNLCPQTIGLGFKVKLIFYSDSIIVEAME
jgi:hypothetical protein